MEGDDSDQEDMKRIIHQTYQHDDSDAEMGSEEGEEEMEEEDEEMNS